MAKKHFIYQFFCIGCLLQIIIPSNCQGQNVNIPDNNFKQRLILEGVDTNNDGEISFEEAGNVSSLDISLKYGLYISDITGIEAFINLDTLNCEYNILTTIIGVNNLPIKYFDCSDNLIDNFNVQLDQLTYLDLYNNNLSGFNASNFGNLSFLQCSPTESLTIDNPQLEELYVESIISINVTQAPILKKLICKPGDSLDLSNNLEQVYLHIPGYYGSISEIDVTNNTLLEHLTIDSLDLSHNDSLYSVSLSWIYNPKGSLVFATTFYSDELKVDLATLPKGLYIANILNSNGIRSEKIIVQ